MPPSRALLRGLGHPHPDEIKGLRELVEWLEHTKIRFYPSDARGPLTDNPDGPEWRTALSKYLSDVGCPREAAATAPAADDNDDEKKKDDDAVASWLLYHALTLSYADETRATDEEAMPMESKGGGEEAEDEQRKNEKEKIDSEIAAHVDAGVSALDAADASAPAAGGGPPFVDLGSRAVQRACDELCSALGVPEKKEEGGGGGGGAPSSLVARLESAEVALTERYLPAASAFKAASSATPSSSSSPTGASTFAAALLDAQPLGFSTGDAAVDRGARALRWLYVRDLAELQRDVDSAIVAVQDRTADPRTDAALGKVGR